MFEIAFHPAPSCTTVEAATFTKNCVINCLSNKISTFLLPPSPTFPHHYQTGPIFSNFHLSYTPSSSLHKSQSLFTYTYSNTHYTFLEPSVLFPPVSSWAKSPRVILPRTRLSIRARYIDTRNQRPIFSYFGFAIWTFPSCL